MLQGHADNLKGDSRLTRRVGSVDPVDPQGPQGPKGATGAAGREVQAQRDWRTGHERCQVVFQHVVQHKSRAIPLKADYLFLVGKQLHHVGNRADELLNSYPHPCI